MNRFRYMGSVARAVITTVLAVAIGIAASIALAHSGGASAPKPAISVRFPDGHRWYGNRRWFAGCRHGVGLSSTQCVPFRCKYYLCRAGRGIRGVASERDGIGAVLVSVRRDGDRSYRDNGTFSVPRAHYVRAMLARHGTSVQWFRWLGLPRRDGWYTVRALLIPGGGSAADPAATATVTFAADHTPPAAPQLIVHSTGAGSVRLRFSDRRAHVTFRCRLDDGAWSRCRSPLSHSQLSDGRHVFSVRAVDRYGRSGPATRRSTPAQVSGGARLTISGRPAGLLYPGGAAEPISLRLTNPGSEPIVVTGLSVGMRPSTLPGGCDPAGFVVTQSNISAANPIELAPHGSATLPSAAVVAPAIRMLDTATNQDACEGNSLALRYKGRAHR